jgi:hypothetical protein
MSVDAQDPPSPLEPYPPSGAVGPPELLLEPELDACPELEAPPEPPPEPDDIEPPDPEPLDAPPPPPSSPEDEPPSVESKPFPGVGVLVPQPSGPSLPANASEPMSARRAARLTFDDSIGSIAGK